MHNLSGPRITLEGLEHGGDRSAVQGDGDDTGATALRQQAVYGAPGRLNRTRFTVPVNVGGNDALAPQPFDAFAEHVADLSAELELRWHGEREYTFRGPTVEPAALPRRRRGWRPAR